nr:G2/mitotic-specific cyclin S13-7-like isoform X1 [Ipomoea batatas]
MAAEGRNHRVLGDIGNMVTLQGVEGKQQLSQAACGGLNIKLPKEKIEDIDAGDVYNELTVVEYAEDIYKFYKEFSKKYKVHSYNRNGLCALGFMDDPYRRVRSAFSLLN